MPRASLLDTRRITFNEIQSLFKKAIEFRELQKQFGSFVSPDQKNQSKVIACLFFEPSTRTRMSFQMAAYRLGHQVLAMELAASSSLSKGETYLDTVLNVLAMRPDALVIRYGESKELDEALPQLETPIINGGSGTTAHPTQALLDAFTIQEAFGSVKDKKVLIVGDIQHSRVARSNFDVLSKLGAKIGVSGPSGFLPNEQTITQYGISVFNDLNEGVSWCDVYMGLRIQLERHAASELKLASLDEYHQRFGLNQPRLKLLKENAIILHPGPINHGVEFAHEVAQDPRNRVLTQVANGVLIRAAVLS
ncbi:MAG TPA: aspartate carbamoyltransferase catalytic subunit [Bdellovibrionales bacterium]|nr:aspartate carbamoyltransferase catalytic subunit [Bdellovibrionales bacterium]